jgi:type 1 glutamine amidotransferase
MNVVACAIGVVCTAAAAAPQTGAGLRALYVSGGGWHEFKALAPLLTAGISHYANVTWDIRCGTETMRTRDFARTYDVVVYNGCFDQADDPADLTNALDTIRGGSAAVMIHCAAHSFKYSDGWTAAVGLRTRKHDDFKALRTTKPNPTHPVVRFWPETWSTTGDEMYRNIEFPSTSTPLLIVHSVESNADHVVAWVHQYGLGRVFGTTLGHGMETGRQARYHHLLANGVLWATGRLGEDGKPMAGYGGRDSE